MQGHTVGRVPGIRDRLLVNHFGTRRTADLWQLTSDGAGFGQSQGFCGLEHRHNLAHRDRQGRIIRPLRLIGQSDGHVAAADGLRDERHHRADRALIGEGAAWLKEAGQRVVVKLHAEADRRRDPDLRRGGVACARAGHGDRGHAEARGIATSRWGRARNQLGATGEGNRRCGGVACSRSSHINACHEAIAEQRRGCRPAAAATADGDSRSHRIGLVAAGDREAGGTEPAECCCGRGRRAAGRRRDADSRRGSVTCAFE